MTEQFTFFPIPQQILRNSLFFFRQALHSLMLRRTLEQIDDPQFHVPKARYHLIDSELTKHHRKKYQKILDT